MARSGFGSQPPDSRPTRDLDPTELARLIPNARPSYADLDLPTPELDLEMAEGTPPPTPLTAFDRPTERLPVQMFPLFGVAAPVAETVELPLDELSLDQSEVQPLEQVRAQRAFLRIDTHDELRSEITSPVLVPKKARALTAGSQGGTSVGGVRRRIPWRVCAIAVVAAAVVTALLMR